MEFSYRLALSVRVETVFEGIAIPCTGDDGHYWCLQHSIHFGWNPNVDGVQYVGTI